jgi:prepilin-type N-terminal cleavage/methylation domain-containing protein
MKIKKIRKNKNGFTLFELLVSISIIAVLTAIAVVSFGGLNKKTRDARRMSDLEKVRLSLEAARQIGTTYPGGLADLINMGLLDRIPGDPKGASYNYYYGRGADNYTYILCAQMEDVGSANTTSNCGTNRCGAGNSCNYRLYNP